MCSHQLNIIVKKWLLRSSKCDYRPQEEDPDAPGTSSGHRLRQVDKRLNLRVHVENSGILELPLREIVIELKFWSNFLIFCFLIPTALYRGAARQRFLEGTVQKSAQLHLWLWGLWTIQTASGSSELSGKWWPHHETVTWNFCSKCSSPVIFEIQLMFCVMSRTTMTSLTHQWTLAQ